MEQLNRQQRRREELKRNKQARREARRKLRERQAAEGPPLTDTRRSPAARRDGDCDGPSVLRLASPPGESSWRPGSKFPGNVPPPRKSPATPAHIRSAAASRHEFARQPTTTLCWLNF